MASHALHTPCLSCHTPFSIARSTTTALSTSSSSSRTPSQGQPERSGRGRGDLERCIHRKETSRWVSWSVGRSVAMDLVVGRSRFRRPFAIKPVRPDQPKEGETEISAKQPAGCTGRREEASKRDMCPTYTCCLIPPHSRTFSPLIPHVSVVCTKACRELVA